MKATRLALFNRKTGKQASRRKQSILGQMLPRSGIITLLPTCYVNGTGGLALLSIEILLSGDEVRQLHKNYEVREVRCRDGSKTGCVPMRELVRQQAISDKYIVALFDIYVADDQVRECGTLKGFIKWLLKNLESRNSSVYLLTAKVAPDVLLAMPKERWWHDQIADRRKNAELSGAGSS
jgi:hypothetical protein